uniref:Uncharacterized protein n=1 Tax=Anguilla anguilla TaxID=7936 RepID=A0A0E9WCN1_ANGAN
MQRNNKHSFPVIFSFRYIPVYDITLYASPLAYFSPAPPKRTQS